jgi:NTP pyrophosphatase (non-canonical NTP hydrolase)
MPVKFKDGRYLYEVGPFTFNQYQDKARLTATYKDVGYLPLGLTEEVGELVHEFAKAKRTGVEIDRDAVKDELGDVLWVLSQIARENGFTLEEAARFNIEKLTKRSFSGSIHNKKSR